MSAAKAVFDAPDTPVGRAPSRARPVDLAHLATQTMGDKALEDEVLQIFARQARACLQTLVSGEESAKAVAHRLKGAASAVGAFQVAAAAAVIEAGSEDAAAIAAVGAAIVEAEQFITGLRRG